MLIPYVCPKCGTRGTVSSNLIGKSISCLNCSANIVIKEQMRSKRTDTFMIVDSDDMSVEEPQPYTEPTNFYQPLNYPKTTEKKTRSLASNDDTKDITKILTRKVSEKLHAKNNTSTPSGDSEEIDADDLAIDTSVNVKYITKKFKQDKQQEIQRIAKQKEAEEDKRIDNLEDLVKTKKFMQMKSPIDRRVPCPHCGSIILQKDKICKYCEKDIDLTSITSITSIKAELPYSTTKSYLRKKTEDTQMIEIVKSKRKRSRSISYFKIFGGILLFAALFLPWFNTSLGIQIALEREVPKTIIPSENKTPAEIQVTKSKTQMFVQAFITPAIFALTFIGLIIGLFEILGKKLHTFFSIIPVVMLVFLLIALKDVQWATMNFALPVIFLGCILIFIPGKKITPATFTKPAK